MDAGLVEAAQLFKVLGHESRLLLLRLIGEESRTVGALAEATNMSQPLVSQHLRTLRGAGLVAAQRRGKEVIYEIADLHVSHVVSDALEHVREPRSASSDAERQNPTPRKDAS
ncbi:MAG TPA: metalloregulator ArsR/SmtB family transcription factor [Arachnia sp.]|nr:metalloregulator ArsR/SmtB family transcription factor [Arachnia sp.]HMT85566.1 metalloregulator ArsR/SmtB family transcription factor [Arachnia sp.]